MKSLTHSAYQRVKAILPMQSLSRAYPWLIWLLASGFIFYKYLLQVSPTVMVNELMSTFSLTGTALGNLGACYFYAYLLMQLPVGVLLDHYNPRNLIAVAILVCSLGAFIFSKATHLWVADLGRVLIGLGGAFSAVGTMKLIALWFPPKRFALVSGLMMTMAMLGAVGGEGPFSQLVLQHGWRQAMMISALLGLMLACAICLIVRTKPKQEENIPSSRLALSVMYRHVCSLLKDTQSWLLALYSGLAFAPVSAFAGFWGVPYLMIKTHLSRPMVAGQVSLVFIGFAIGAPLAGWLSDRIGRRKPIMLVGTSMSLLTLCLILKLPTLSSAVLSGLLTVFGIASGCFFVSFATMRERHSAEMSGASIGFINMFNALCGALAEPIIGQLLDLGWQHESVGGVRMFSVMNYQHALLILPIALTLAIILLLRVKETYCLSARD